MVSLNLNFFIDQAFGSFLQRCSIAYPFVEESGLKDLKEELCLKLTKLLKPLENRKIPIQEPFLQKIIGQISHFWIESSLELLHRFAQDREVIQSTFGPADLGSIAHFQMGMGDPHNEGREVTILTFTSGWKLVYKPRKIHGEWLFNQFLEWFNQHHLTAPVKTLKLLEQGEYGWIEWIEHRSCNKKIEIHQFYHNLGVQLGIFYLLQGVDLHFENLIASAETPYIVDAETLLTPLFLFEQNVKKNHPFNILYTLAFPIHQLETPFEVAAVDFVGGNKGSHCPQLNSKSVSAENYREDIIRGFQNCLKFALSNKNLILDFIASKAEGKQFRVVLRKTQGYFSLLKKMLEFEYENDEQETLEELDRQLTWSFTNGEQFKAVIDAEKCALRRQDIPYFYSTPFSKDLFSEKGEIVREGFFEKSAFEALKEHILNMDERDVEIQTECIENSYLLTQLKKVPSVHIAAKEAGSHNDTLLNSAEAIAHTLLEHASKMKEAMVWVAPKRIFDNECYRFLSPSLYDGYGGIALFFAALAAITKEDWWEKSAKESIKALLTKIKEGKSSFLIRHHGLGGLEGIASTIYVLNHMGTLLNDPTLHGAAEQLLEGATEEEIGRDNSFDILAGSAGVILSLLSAFEMTKKEVFLERAIIAGNHLLAKATRKENRVMWYTSFTDRALTGFSHGQSGIAYALCKLSALSGNGAFKEAFIQALEYERLFFSAEHQNWLDLRKEEVHCGNAWCHGAPGIGMSRLAMLAYHDEKEIRHEIDIALKTAETTENWANSLCCGQLGRLEFFKLANERIGSLSAKTKQDQLLASILERQKNQNGFEDIASLGFFQGIAGLGYSLLRQHPKSQQLPCVLILE